MTDQCDIAKRLQACSGVQTYIQKTAAHAAGGKKRGDDGMTAGSKVTEGPAFGTGAAREIRIGTVRCHGIKYFDAAHCMQTGPACVTVSVIAAERKIHIDTSP